MMPSLNFLLMKTAFKADSKEQSRVFWADVSADCNYNGTTTLSFPLHLCFPAEGNNPIIGLDQSEAISEDLFIFHS